MSTGAAAGSSNSSSSKSNAGAIAGGVVGGIAGLAILGGLIFFFYRRRKGNKRLNETAGLGEKMFDPSRSAGHGYSYGAGGTGGRAGGAGLGAGAGMAGSGSATALVDLVEDRQAGVNQISPFTDGMGYAGAAAGAGAIGAGAAAYGSSHSNSTHTTTNYNSSSAYGGPSSSAASNGYPIDDATYASPYNPRYSGGYGVAQGLASPTFAPGQSAAGGGGAGAGAGGYPGYNNEGYYDDGQQGQGYGQGQGQYDYGAYNNPAHGGGYAGADNAVEMLDSGAGQYAPAAAAAGVGAAAAGPPLSAAAAAKMREVQQERERYSYNGGGGGPMSPIQQQQRYSQSQSHSRDSSLAGGYPAGGSSEGDILDSQRQSMGNLTSVDEHEQEQELEGGAPRASVLVHSDGGRAIQEEDVTDDNERLMELPPT